MTASIVRWSGSSTIFIDPVTLRSFGCPPKSIIGQRIEVARSVAVRGLCRLEQVFGVQMSPMCGGRFKPSSTELQFTSVDEGRCYDVKRWIKLFPPGPRKIRNGRPGPGRLHGDRKRTALPA